MKKKTHFIIIAIAYILITFKALHSQQVVHTKNIMPNKYDSLSLKMSCRSLSLIDSIAVQNMGSIIALIVFDADSIGVEVKNVDENEQDKCKVIGWKSQLLKYMLCQKCMYVSNKPVFGLFSPYVIVYFYKEGNIVEALFDYGINKWRLMDNETNLVVEKDIPDGMLLPLFYSLFPSNDLIRMTYNDYLKK